MREDKDEDGNEERRGFDGSFGRPEKIPAAPKSLGV